MEKELLTIDSEGYIVIRGRSNGNVNFRQYPQAKGIVAYLRNLQYLYTCGMPNLQVIDIDYNSVSDVCFIDNPNLEEISLNWNPISEIDVSMCKKLRVLQCRNEGILEKIVLPKGVELEVLDYDGVVNVYSE